MNGTKYNGVNTYRKYSIRVSNGTYHLLLMFLLFYFLWCCCRYCLKISAKQQWNWRLAENEQNKRTTKMIIANTPSGDQILLTLWCCCWCCYLFCVVAADIVLIKTAPPNLYPGINARTFMVLRYTYYKKY